MSDDMKSTKELFLKVLEVLRQNIPSKINFKSEQVLCT